MFALHRATLTRALCWYFVCTTLLYTFNRGGAKVNDVKIDDELHAVSQADFDDASGELKLSSGKKKHAIVEIQG
jgi:hypothetical protein